MSTPSLPNRHPLSLSRRLLVWIAGIFIALVSLTTALQLSLEYSLEEESGAQQIGFALFGSRDVLANALWSFDPVQLAATADLLIAHPLIEGVLIESEDPALNQIRGHLPDPSGYLPTSELDPGYPDIVIASQGRLLQKALQFTESVDFDTGESLYPVGTVTVYSNVRLILSQSSLNFVFTLTSAIFLCVLVVAVTAWSVHRLVARRLTVVERVLAAIEPEDDVFRARLIPDWIGRERDEIATLCDTLNQLQVQLAEKSQRIHQHQSSLEQKIQARTHELEETLEALQISTDHKNQFLANMSHEIRTPMNGIIGMAELLQDTRLDQRQRDYLTTILNSGHTLTTIINDILDLSKIEAGRLELESIRFNLPELVEETLALFIKPSEEKGLLLIADIEPGTPDTIVGDPIRMQQLLLNLLGNAFKFTDDGEIVVHLQWHPDRQRLGVAVSDTGLGIEPDKLTVLFDAFFRAHKSTHRERGGTGLGLAICKRLVELMQGEIGVESEPDKGSTFWFEIPINTIDATPNPKGPFSATECNGLSGNALLITSNLTLQRLFSHHTDATALTLTCASSGVEALALCDQQQFNAILVDATVDHDTGLMLGPTLAGAQPKALLALIASRMASPDWQTLTRHQFKRLMEKPLSLPRSLLNLGENRLPSPSGQPDEEPGLQSPTFPQSHLLLVEDNHINQRVAEGMLRRLGLTVTVTSNGQQALDYLENNVPENELTNAINGDVTERGLLPTRVDLVLMDCEMPVMDGYAATHAIRHSDNDRIRSIPIIGLSAHAMMEQQEKALAAGMDDYLTKPLRRRSLELTLSKWLLAND
ncbi:MAG: ATP-binding protein [Saccharospirillum sp.]